MLLVIYHLWLRDTENHETEYGGIAQLGERLNGIQEVKSSILSVSTRKKHLQRKCFFNEINPYERRQGTEKTENRPLSFSIREPSPDCPKTAERTKIKNA